MQMTMTLNETEQGEAAKLYLEDQGYVVLGEPKVTAGPDGVQVTATVEPKPKRKRAAPAE